MLPLSLKGELGLQFREQGTQPWSVHRDIHPPDTQRLREIAGDRPNATTVYEEFFCSIPFLGKFLLFVSKSVFWRQVGSNFLLGVVHCSPVAPSSATSLSFCSQDYRCEKGT